MANGTGDYNVASNFKKCRKSLFKRYICIPFMGTHVFNKLEKSDHIVDQNTPFVICGTIGEC